MSLLRLRPRPPLHVATVPPAPPQAPLLLWPPVASSTNQFWRRSPQSPRPHCQLSCAPAAYHLILPFLHLRRLQIWQSPPWIWPRRRRCSLPRRLPSTFLASTFGCRRCPREGGRTEWGPDLARDTKSGTVATPAPSPPPRALPDTPTTRRSHTVAALIWPGS